ncbi:MAG: hypothetical protein GQ558_00810 [Thermoplasmata archaeon]|nr:hypothetical protein [Thermoplasmata archaeon]
MCRRTCEGSVVGDDARPEAPDATWGCGVGTGVPRGPGVVLLDGTRLPGAAAPAMVGAGAKVGGGAVIAGMKVGEGAFVAGGEPGACNRSWT